MPTARKLICLVVPVLNEELNIDLFWTEVNQAIAPLRDRYDFDFVFTDNHSSDRTFERLSTLGADHPEVRVIRFSRNFGYQKSIYTGYSAARGEAAIQLDCDLQDPPVLIAELLRLWELGNKVVYGVRLSRKESWWLHMSRKCFYRLINMLSSEPLPLDAGDFRLLDRQVIDELKLHRDAHPYIRGTTAVLGFRQAALPYERDSRRFGETKFSFRKLIELALDGVLNHSIVPLRIASFVGIAVGLLTLIAILVYVVGHFVFGQQWPPGFATTTALLLTGIFLNAVFLGIIGEYLGRIFLEVKRHPIVVIESTVNCSPAQLNFAGDRLSPTVSSQDSTT